MYWCKPMQPSKGHRSRERGNVFIFILLGVVLFAALMFTVSRGLNTGTSTISGSLARNQAIDIINYTQQVERAVARLLEQGVSESDISFENAVVSGYAHSPVVSADAKVFQQASNLGVNWKSPDPQATYQGNNQWIFDGSWIVTGDGDDTRSELGMYLFVKRDVCAELNKQLGVTVDLSVSMGSGITYSKFTGTYADNPARTSANVPVSFCYRGSASEGSQSGEYVFGHMLLAR